MPQFKQVDVFTAVKYKGNPVAVFFDADSLSDTEKSEMSAWTNLSEATFVETPTDPKADYKVRIYSLEKELPFAGHPTVGTCFALLEAGKITPKNGKIVQQCEAGLVELDVSDDKVPSIRFKLPSAKRTDLSPEELGLVAKSLGLKVLDAAIYDVGPVWLTVMVESAQQVSELKPDWAAISKVSENLGLSGFQVIGKYQDNRYETRTFAPYHGVNEDPVCGSGSGATAAFLRDSFGYSGVSYLSQGAALNRAGKVTIHSGDDVYVGGNAVTVIDGQY